MDNRNSQGEKKPESSYSEGGIRELLDRLALRSLVEEETETPAKTYDDFKFWKTQPVPKFDDECEAEGPIDPNTDINMVPKEPYRLLKEFEWTTMNLEDDNELREVYELLTENYVEDSSAMLRFAYSAEFLRWALMSPGYVKDWHVGVRVKASNKLVAFISAVPLVIRVRDKLFEKCAEVNFLCIHKKLRSKRLTPLLIKEVTRRCHLTDVWQAVYTAGILIPSPVSVCRYMHRSLNWKKLYEIGFAPLPFGSSPTKEMAKYHLPSETATPGLRPMEKRDVTQVQSLLSRYLERFELAHYFNETEVQHWFLGNDEVSKGPVIWSYVVEDPKTKRITDFFSFYSLPSSVLGNPKYSDIKAAYLYYYASDSYPKDTSKASSDKFVERCKLLIKDSLILANRLRFDVFNAVTVLDNNLFLKDLRFGEGDGYLNYYIYNYRCPKVPGGIDSEKNIDKSRPSGMGFVMI
ncbi:N-myristoyltransferase 1 [Schizosaccharomyces cryophilus OY26]|uniref:Glycylpeptide N-tetradecanoyltransferase n=1 Tax=Schizosaccharomyces cryophilus (strain OY26 / ATCC MYA-4695 / CBS 11777 / NBRC 106824 / NRRL Y48691) TaxID=653667 RepID=S9X9P6_SCHCR|nr:N-myristoyltransferase 1 [Schizosaccharomyces cryophilus OY26]EPY50486.1 N-myristoyltransferase 1 [Schizosaccharomyces cryophilus OY26]